MTDPLESGLARELAAVLSLSDLEGGAYDRPEFRSLMGSLERFVPSVLSRLYSEWKFESLDGFSFRLVRRLTQRRLELAGLCLLISDQSWTPFHMQLQHDAAIDEIEWMRCRLGVWGESPRQMIRMPWDTPDERVTHEVVENPDEFEWVFTVMLGEEEFSDV